MPPTFTTGPSNEAKKILFFPDEHLGRNTGVKKGIPLDRMIVWDPFLPLGGNTPEAIQIGHGHPLEGVLLSSCRGFSVEQIETNSRRNILVSM